MSKEQDTLARREKVVKRGVATLTALSLLATGCVATEGGQVVAKIADEPTKTSPLSPDFTKTPISSPTDVNYELTPTTDNLATYELDLESIVFPPVSYAKEAYEKGEYEDGLRVINQWVSIWNKMGFFDESIKVEGFKPVILDGSARIVCVASINDKYSKTLYCPPIDMENGGLKAVPEITEQGLNKPLIIKLEGTEGLMTRGKEKELVYQFIDKYQKYPIRYIDAKTGNVVEGSYKVLLEVKENEPIKGSVVCVTDEFCMGGQMTVDQEIGKVFYKKYMEAFLLNVANKEYFNKLLEGELTYEKLQKYIDKNNGYVPTGLKLLYGAGRETVIMAATQKPVNLSALRTIVIGPKQWHDNVGDIQYYLDSFDKDAIVSPYRASGLKNWAYFGWFLDKNDSLVLVNGALDFASQDSSIVLGGMDGKYVPERDNLVATGHALAFIVYTEKHIGPYRGKIVPFFGEPYLSSPQRSDISRILGGNLFKKP
jgi:hypothetical protein